MPIAVVARRGVDRIRAGHPWVYRSDLVHADAAPGDIVAVEAERGRRLGWAFWSSTSQIALRMISTETRGEFDERAWLAARIDAAVRYRETLAPDATAFRLVHAEADRLPGVIVDRYGDEAGAVSLVVQTLSQGADRRLPLVVDTLAARLRPAGILVRNDAKVRRLEGLDEQVTVAAGAIPDRMIVRQHGVRMTVDLRHGQKTGLFLDQRENHAAAGHYARGEALDAFTYQGGFALHLSMRADRVTALESSAAAAEAARANAALNGRTNVVVEEGNVFDQLRELEVAGARFDVVVLDPPAFAKNRASLERAVAGYKEINLRALRLLAPGGHLVTCSCSYHVDEALFLRILAAAAQDARAPVALVEKRFQAADHPILVSVPETYYLKCLVLRRLE
jgi:23S rRNA (cytosine1962-C5)-methyltransferase